MQSATVFNISPFYVLGLLLKLPLFDQPKGAARVMSDSLWWETPDDFQPVSQHPNGKSGGLLEGTDKV